MLLLRYEHPLCTLKRESLFGFIWHDREKTAVWVSDTETRRLWDIKLSSKVAQHCEVSAELYRYLTVKNIFNSTQHSKIIHCISWSLWPPVDLVLRFKSFITGTNIHTNMWPIFRYVVKSFYSEISSLWRLHFSGTIRVQYQQTDLRQKSDCGCVLFDFVYFPEQLL